METHSSFGNLRRFFLAGGTGSAFELGFVRLLVFGGLLFFRVPIHDATPITRLGYWSVVWLGLLGVRLWLLGAAIFAIGFFSTSEVWALEKALLAGAALLSVAPCADVLGIEGIVKAIRRADSGDTAPPPPSDRYRVPEKLYWFLGSALLTFLAIGKVTYGVPVRLEWIGVPLLGSLVFASWVRQAVALLGLFGSVLHRRLWAFFLLSFLDWDRIFLILGRFLFRTYMVVAYDSKCKICRRTAASLRTFDVLRRIDWVEAQDDQALAQWGWGDYDKVALVTDIHGFSGAHVYRGYETYQQIAWRIPILWPVAPLLYLPPVAHVGRRIYRRIADSRTCTIRSEPMAAREDAHPSLIPVLAVFVVLLVGTIVTSLYFWRWPPR